MADPVHYPARLLHETLGWIHSGATFHIRVRLQDGYPTSLTRPSVGRALLDAARLYHDSLRWDCRLILLMPDHVHALLRFPAREDLSRVVDDWKRFTARKLGLAWQNNFFDHRIRSHKLLQEAGVYIRRNPVAKGLCEHERDWPWVWPVSEAG